MKVAIIGYGKMGKEIHRILSLRGHEVKLIIDMDNAQDLCKENLEGIDVAIEFSTPDTAFSNICKCLECGCAIVSGTTGWISHMDEVKNLCKEKNGAFFYSSNYSLGVNIFFRLNRYAAELMNRFSQYNVTVEETHHIHKKDAPSGTAITIADDIISRLDRKNGWVNESEAAADIIPIISYREGEVPGIHTVTYRSEVDTLTMTHSLESRSALAEGAVAAAEFLCGKKGVYSMDDIFNE